MTIAKTFEDKKLTLVIEGRLDSVTSQQFHDSLIPAFDEAREIILDFSKVEYISSAGLHILLIGQKTANSKKITMKLLSVSDDVMEVLEMTGFTNMLTIVQQ
ncbi:MAG: STAS domain-containing protein [Spirochaetaceae bacterium]|nr:STAS domain-containing protein [Spirochaetaceae bacterium]